MARNLKEQSGAESAKFADDILLFFYDLSDHYRIVRSSNAEFSGPCRTILKEVIYNLESHPDETVYNQRWRDFILRLLELIATGKISLSRAQR